MPSVSFLDAALSQETDEVFLVLLAITHPDLAGLEASYPELDLEGGALRFVANTEDIVSNGHTYTAFGFSLILPDEGDDAAQLATLVIDNVDRRIALTLRSLQTKPGVSVQVVLASEPDYVEEDYPQFEFAGASWDALEVKAELGLQNDTDAPLCDYEFNPNNAPGLGW